MKRSQLDKAHWKTLKEKYLKAYKKQKKQTAQIS